MVYKVVLTFESVDEILKCDYASETALFCCAAVFFYFSQVLFVKHLHDFVSVSDVR